MTPLELMVAKLESITTSSLRSNFLRSTEYQLPQVAYVVTSLGALRVKSNVQ